MYNVQIYDIYMYVCMVYVQYFYTKNWAQIVPKQCSLFKFEVLKVLNFL